MLFRSYSSFINLTKKILICVSIFLIILIFSNRTSENRNVSKNSKSENNEAIQQVITNPRFIGSDSKNRPYTLVAKEAKKIKSKLNIYELIHPEGNLINKNGQYINVKSLEGIFNQESEVLSLNDNVILENHDGYVFKTESASIDLNREHIFGDRDITGRGPRGFIKSQGFEINEQGKQIFFLGRSTLFLKNK